MIYVYGIDPFDYSPSSKQLYKQLKEAGFKRSELEYVEEPNSLPDNCCVLCFGAKAFNTLTGRAEPLTSHHGELYSVQDKPGALVFPTYAPGYLYHNPKAIPFFKDDLSLFKAFITLDERGEVI